MSSLAPVGAGNAAGTTLSLPPWLQSAAQGNAFQGIQNLGAYNLYNPNAATNYATNIQNNPFSSGMVSSVGQGAASGQYGAQNLFNTGNQVLNTAFDPQSALYSQYRQLTEQQNQARAAQSGLGTSPYGVGLENQSMGNFNIGWQQQQLQNQIAGLSAAEGAFKTALPLFMQSAMAPYQAYQGVNQDAFSALSALQQYGITGATIPQQQIQDWAGLLGLQPALAGAQNATAAEQSRLQQTALGQIGGGIAGGLEMLPGIGNMLGGGAGMLGLDLIGA
jgi:hypothetical protein